jgi:hypothetical protein
LGWEFVSAREKIEGRNIRPEDFVEQYFAARQVVNTLKLEFVKQIQVDLILKNRDNSTKVILTSSTIIYRRNTRLIRAVKSYSH